MEIPKISFSPSGNSETIDVIDLEELMARDNLVENHSPFELHRLNFNLIMIFTGKTASHTVDFKKIELKKNDTLVLTKGQVHSFGEKENYVGHLILFNDEFSLRHLSHSAKQHLDIIRPFHLRSPKFTTDQTILNHLFDLKKTWKNQNQLYFEDFLANQVLKILLHFQAQETLRNDRFEKNENQNLYIQLFFQFNSLIQKSERITRNAQFYASEMAITYKVLNKICKETTGFTAKEYIDQIVILEAKRLLVASHIPTTEIAMICGFDEATNFSKYFKKQTGNTPKQFKSKFILG